MKDDITNNIQKLVTRFSSKNVISASIYFLEEQVEDLAENFNEEYEFNSTLNTLTEEGFDTRKLSSKIKNLQSKRKQEKELITSILADIKQIKMEEG